MPLKDPEARKAYQQAWHQANKERILAEHYQRRKDDPEKQKRIQRNWRKKQGDERRAMLAEIKQERGCIDCGYNTHAVALDFDHRPGTEKLFNISRQGLFLTWEKVLAEIAKCDVRCANCHRVKTHERLKEAA
jgi:hypothetical protein